MAEQFRSDELERSGSGTEALNGSAAAEASDLQLLAATAALLARYGDRSELIVGYGSNAAGRTRALVLDVSGDPSFAELEARVRQILDPSSDGAPPDGETELDALVVADRNQRRLLVRRHGALVEPDQLDPLRGHLEMLLAGATADPDRPVGMLDLLSAQERLELLVRFNDTAAAYPSQSMHELFEAQMQRTPDAIAVQFEGDALTYAQLDERANRFAHHLAALGVGPEVLVGICVERSLEMVVGLLGIMKSGGAYVPIDPAYPAERQEFMLTSSQAPVIVTQERLRASLPPTDATIVCLDSDWPAIARCSAHAPATATDAEQLAYVIYTSGSTGQPKGVQISHRALVNFLVSMRETPGLAPDDVLVAVTTLSFDIAGLELYLPLITGARVVVAPAATGSDPRALTELLAESHATIMQATPTTWRMLIDSGWAARPGLKALCGGEALPVALADRLVAAGLELWNMYGPTETTIWSTCARIETQGEPLAIGRPIANTTLYILDPRLEPVPVGVPGELWIGGDGLARGYRGRADLTEERFVVHPFAPGGGARIYRTGDLARYRPDGNVEFLGRIDHQVKVRGFRIELGEIETVLARHPGVVEAVVVARGAGAEADLAAYVIAGAAPVSAYDLRQYLMHKLPSYMVPSTVTALERFPLTPNGKVDRKALPEPTRERAADHALIGSRTELERKLTRIWERELDTRPIGVTDNFFDLGVTSIVAARLFAAIEQEAGDKLPLGAIFKAPTIERLARLIEDGADAARWSSLVAIQPQGTRPPIFCVHGGGGTVLHLEPLARRLGNDQPFYGLQSRGLYGGEAPLQTVEEMASHYLSEMRQVNPDGPWYITGYCFGAIVAFELASSLAAAGEDVRLLASFNGPSPSWIHRWGWYGNQPSQRDRHKRTPKLTKGQRLLRAVREPRRVLTGLAWQTRLPRARLALKYGRPLPESLREFYFFRLHHFAERAYEPKPYGRDMLVFYGSGLYEDPELGWGGLAQGGTHAFAIPGEHDNNRQAMTEPGVEFVSDRLREYLATTETDGDPEAPGPAAVEAAPAAIATAEAHTR
jgi:amino acid adenylation domain-containing protein